MQAGFNKDLSLFQINEHPKPNKIFNKNYPFYTGSSKYMIKHFKNIQLLLKINWEKKFDRDWL